MTTIVHSYFSKSISVAALFLLAFFGFVSFVEAGEYKAIINDKPVTVKYDGLIPCGRCVGLEPGLGGKEDSICQQKWGTKYPHDVPCTICHVFILGQNILNELIFKIVPLVGALIAVWAGFRMILERGNPTEWNKAKQMLWYVFLGVLIIYGAWIIVNTILVATGFLRAEIPIELGKIIKVADWFKINCEINIKI